jgi:hypothetical protein
MSYHARRLGLSGSLFAGLVLLSGHVLGQDGVASHVQKLTGGNAREWVLQQIITSMGPTPGCTQGESYRFTANNKVTVSKCDGSQLKSSTYDWKIEQLGSIDVAVTFNNQRYYVLFRDVDDKHFMRLQVRSDSKTNPSRDFELRLADD